jgi:hypothetical protein
MSNSISLFSELYGNNPLSTRYTDDSVHYGMHPSELEELENDYVPLAHKKLVNSTFSLNAKAALVEGRTIQKTLGMDGFTEEEVEFVDRDTVNVIKRDSDGNIISRTPVRLQAYGNLDGTDAEKFIKESAFKQANQPGFVAALTGKSENELTTFDYDNVKAYETLETYRAATHAGKDMYRTNSYNPAIDYTIDRTPKNAKVMLRLSGTDRYGRPLGELVNPSNGKDIGFEFAANPFTNTAFNVYEALNTKANKAGVEAKYRQHDVLDTFAKMKKYQDRYDADGRFPEDLDMLKASFYRMWSRAAKHGPEAIMDTDYWSIVADETLGQEIADAWAGVNVRTRRDLANGMVKAVDQWKNGDYSGSALSVFTQLDRILAESAAQTIGGLAVGAATGGIASALGAGTAVAGVISTLAGGLAAAADNTMTSIEEYKANNGKDMPADDVAKLLATNLVLSVPEMLLAKLGIGKLLPKAVSSHMHSMYEQGARMKSGTLLATSIAGEYAQERFEDTANKYFSQSQVNPESAYDIFMSPEQAVSGLAGGMSGGALSLAPAIKGFVFDGHAEAKAEAARQDALKQRAAVNILGKSIDAEEDAKIAAAITPMPANADIKDVVRRIKDYEAIITDTKVSENTSNAAYKAQGKLIHDTVMAFKENETTQRDSFLKAVGITAEEALAIQAANSSAVEVFMDTGKRLKKSAEANINKALEAYGRKLGLSESTIKKTISQVAREVTYGYKGYKTYRNVADKLMKKLEDTTLSTEQIAEYEDDLKQTLNRLASFRDLQYKKLETFAAALDQALTTTSKDGRVVIDYPSGLGQLTLHNSDIAKGLESGAYKNLLTQVLSEVRSMDKVLDDIPVAYKEKFGIGKRQEEITALHERIRLQLAKAPELLINPKGAKAAEVINLRTGIDKDRAMHIVRELAKNKKSIRGDATRLARLSTLSDENAEIVYNRIQADSSIDADIKSVLIDAIKEARQRHKLNREVVEKHDADKTQILANADKILPVIEASIEDLGKAKNANALSDAQRRIRQLQELAKKLGTIAAAEDEEGGKDLRNAKVKALELVQKINEAVALLDKRINDVLRTADELRKQGKQKEARKLIRKWGAEHLDTKSKDTATKTNSTKDKKESMKDFTLSTDASNASSSYWQKVASSYGVRIVQYKNKGDKKKISLTELPRWMFPKGKQGDKSYALYKKLAAKAKKQYEEKYKPLVKHGLTIKQAEAFYGLVKHIAGYKPGKGKETPKDFSVAIRKWADSDDKAKKIDSYDDNYLSKLNTLLSIRNSGALFVIADFHDDNYAKHPSVAFAIRCAIHFDRPIYVFDQNPNALVWKYYDKNDFTFKEKKTPPTLTKNFSIADDHKLTEDGKKAVTALFKATAEKVSSTIVDTAVTADSNKQTTDTKSETSAKPKQSSKKETLIQAIITKDKSLKASMLKNFSEEELVGMAEEHGIATDTITTTEEVPSKNTEKQTTEEHKDDTKDTKSDKKPIAENKKSKKKNAEDKSKEDKKPTVTQWNKDACKMFKEASVLLEEMEEHKRNSTLTDELVENYEHVLDKLEEHERKVPTSTAKETTKNKDRLHDIAVKIFAIVEDYRYSQEVEAGKKPSTPETPTPESNEDTKTDTEESNTESNQADEKLQRLMWKQHVELFLEDDLDLHDGVMFYELEEFIQRIDDFMADVPRPEGEIETKLLERLRKAKEMVNDAITHYDEEDSEDVDAGTDIIDKSLGIDHYLDMERDELIPILEKLTENDPAYSALEGKQKERALSRNKNKILEAYFNETDAYSKNRETSIDDDTDDAQIRRDRNYDEDEKNDKDSKTDKNDKDKQGVKNNDNKQSSSTKNSKKKNKQSEKNAEIAKEQAKILAINKTLLESGKKANEAKEQNDADVLSNIEEERSQLREQEHVTTSETSEILTSEVCSEVVDFKPAGGAERVRITAPAIVNLRSVPEAKRHSSVATKGLYNIPYMKRVISIFNKMRLNFRDVDTTNSKAVSEAHDTFWSFVSTGPHVTLLYGKEHIPGDTVNMATLLAVDYSLKEWLSSMNPKNVFTPRSYEDVFKRFGLNDETTSNKAGAVLLKHTKKHGVPKNSLAIQLGQLVLDNLGVARVKSDDANYGAYQLYVAGMGALALDYAVASGIFVYDKIDPVEVNEDFNSGRKSDKTEEGEVKENKVLLTAKDAIRTVKVTKDGMDMIFAEKTLFKGTTKPVLDADGKPVLDAFGNPKTEKANNGLQALYGSENETESTLGPSTKPIKTTDYENDNNMFVDGTNRMLRVPKFVRHIIDKLQNTAHSINTELANLVVANRTQVAANLGVVADADLVNMSLSERESQEGRNADIENQLDDLQEYSERQQTEDVKGWFFKMFMSRNGRIFYDSPRMNPQSGKAIIRFLMQPTKAEQIFDTKSAKHAEYEAYALSQAFDCLGNAEYSAALARAMNNMTLAETKACLEDFTALSLDAWFDKYNVLLNNRKAEQDASITIKLDAVENYGQALVALQHLYRKQAALAAGKTSFKSWLAVENDSTTSGYVIRLMQFPVPEIMKEFAHKLGIFREGDKDFAKIPMHILKKKAGFLDIYKTMGAWLGERLASVFAEDSTSAIKAVKALYEAFEERKKSNHLRLDKDLLAKTFNKLSKALPKPDVVVNADGTKTFTVSKALRTLMKPLVMVFGYTGGEKAISENMAYDVMVSTVNTFMDVMAEGGLDAYIKNHNLSEKDKASVTAIMETMSDIADMQKDIGKSSKKLEELCQLLKEKHIEEIRLTYKSKGKTRTISLDEFFIELIAPVYGTNSWDILQDKFKGHQQYSELMNAAANGMFAVFSKIFAPAEAAMLRTPNLTEGQYRNVLNSLEGIFPMIPLLYNSYEVDPSISAKEGMHCGLPLFQQQKEAFRIGNVSNPLPREFAENSSVDTAVKEGKDNQKTRLKNAPSNESKLTQSLISDVSVSTVSPNILSFVEPKKAGAVLPIHFIDGMLMAYVMSSTLGIPVHDAIVMSFAIMDEVSSEYNGALFDINGSYNLLEMFYNRLAAVKDVYEQFRTGEGKFAQYRKTFIANTKNAETNAALVDKALPPFSSIKIPDGFGKDFTASELLQVADFIPESLKSAGEVTLNTLGDLLVVLEAAVHKNNADRAALYDTEEGVYICNLDCTESGIASRTSLENVFTTFLDRYLDVNKKQLKTERDQLANINDSRTSEEIEATTKPKQVSREQQVREASTQAFSEYKAQKFQETKSATTGATLRLQGSSPNSIHTDNAQIEELVSKADTDPEARVKLVDRVNEIAEETGNIVDTQEFVEHIKNLIRSLNQNHIVQYAIGIIKNNDFNTGLTDNVNKQITLKLDSKKSSDNDKTTGFSVRTHQSPVEMYGHEIVHASTYYALTVLQALGANTIIHKLLHLQSIAVDKVTWEDFMPSTYDPALKDMYEARAKDTWNYLFKNKDNNDSLYSLAEFMAYGLTNPKVMEKLKNTKLVEKKVTGSAFHRLVTLFKNLLGIITGRTTLGDTAQSLMDLFKGNRSLMITKDTTLYDELNKLVISLSHADKKIANRCKLHPENLIKAIYKPYQLVMKYGNGFLKPVISKTINYLDEHDLQYHPLFETNLGWFKFGRNLTNLALGAMFSKSRRAALPKAFARMMGASQQNFAACIYRDITLPDQDSAALEQYSLHSRVIDACAKGVEANSYMSLSEGFDRELNDDEAEALTRGCLFTDLQCLTKSMDIKEIKENLTNAFALESSIRNAEDTLRKMDSKDYIWLRNQCFGLARFMVFGVGCECQNLNAYSIATKQMMDKNVHKMNEDLVAIVDKLTTLYALSFTDKDTKNILATLSDDGLRNYLHEHTTFINESTLGQSRINEQERETFEKDTQTVNLIHAIKGYTKQILDDSVETKVDLLSNRENLENAGYTLVKEFDNKIVSPNARLGIFRRGLSKPNRREGASFVLGGVHAIGTTLVDSAFNINNSMDKSTAAGEIYKYHVRLGKIRHAVNAKMKSKIMSMSDFEQSSGYVPVLNEDGEVADYRITMATDTKINTLGMEMNGLQILSKMYGSQNRKLQAKVQNHILTDFLYYHMDRNMNFATHKDAYENKYIRIYSSTDNEFLRKAWKVIPKELKDRAEERVLYVREDWLQSLFGEENISAVNALDKLKWQNKYIARTKQGVRITEMILQAAAYGAKKAIILFTPSVLVNNMVSNTNYIDMMHGIGFGKAALMQLQNARATKDYLDNRKELNDIIYKQRQGKATDAEIAKKSILRTKMQHNRVAPLMEMGFWQSIVEDLSTTDLESTSKLQKFFKQTKLFKKAPKALKTLMHTLYLGEGTFIHNFMAQATQFSDFAARATEYQLQMENAPKKYEKVVVNGVVENRITDEYLQYERKVYQDILNAFINYDKPQSAYEQYANDNGLIMFSKFGKRIQPVIAKSLIENPMGCLMFFIKQCLFINNEDILEQNAFAKRWLNLGHNVVDNIYETAMPVPVQYLLGKSW